MHPFALVTITYPSYFLTEPDMASKKWLEIPEKENFGKIESNRIQFYAFLISLRVIKENYIIYDWKNVLLTLILD